MKLIPVMTRKDFSSGNPGDVYICLGLQYLMEKTYGRTLPWYYFNKFSPEDFKRHSNILQEAGFLIYAGTPQYNNYDDWCLWYDWPVWQEYIIPLGLKFHSVAGGSGFPDPHMTPKQFSQYCRSSGKTQAILNSRGIRTGLNTVRDPHALQLLTDSGFPAYLLPCTATWSSRYLKIRKTGEARTLLIPPNPAALTLQMMGVQNHQELSHKIVSQWTALFRALKDESPLVVCHSEAEYRLFSAAGLPTYFTNDVVALMNIFAEAKQVVSSRLHACLPAHGLGVEHVVSVSVDTRGSAVELCNIPQVPHTDFNIDAILEKLKVRNVPDLACWESKYSTLFEQHLVI